MKKKIHGFISYSHKDKELFSSIFDAFEKHLNKTLNFSLIAWSDYSIKPGQKWNKEITMAMKKANFGMLLLSPDFFSSDYIRNVELPEFLERAENDEDFVLFPILIRKVNLSNHPNIKKFQILRPESTNNKQLTYSHLYHEKVSLKLSSTPQLDDFHITLAAKLEERLKDKIKDEEQINAKNISEEDKLALKESFGKLDDEVIELLITQRNNFVKNIVGTLKVESKLEENYIKELDWQLRRIRNYLITDNTDTINNYVVFFDKLSKSKMIQGLKSVKKELFNATKEIAIRKKIKTATKDIIKKLS